MKINTKNRIKNILSELSCEKASMELCDEMSIRTKRILDSDFFKYKFINIQWDLSEQTRYVFMPSIEIYLLSGEKIKISLSVEEYLDRWRGKCYQ